MQRRGDLLTHCEEVPLPLPRPPALRAVRACRQRLRLRPALPAATPDRRHPSARAEQPGHQTGNVVRDAERRPDETGAGPLDLDPPELCRCRVLEPLHQPSGQAQLDAVGETNGDHVVTGLVGRRDRLVRRVECRPRNRCIDVGVRRDDLVRCPSHGASPPMSRNLTSPTRTVVTGDYTEAAWVMLPVARSQDGNPAYRVWYRIRAPRITSSRTTRERRSKCASETARQLPVRGRSAGRHAAAATRAWTFLPPRGTSVTRASHVHIPPAGRPRSCC